VDEFVPSSSIREEPPQIDYYDLGISWQQVYEPPLILTFPALEFCVPETSYLMEDREREHNISLEPDSRTHCVDISAFSLIFSAAMDDNMQGPDTHLAREKHAPGKSVSVFCQNEC